MAKQWLTPLPLEIQPSQFGTWSTFHWFENERCKWCHAGLRLGFGIAMIPVQGSRRRLATWSIFGSANPKGSGSGGSGLGTQS
jgi:hypothetical protein